MSQLFRSVEPTAAEARAAMPGDGLLPAADVVMDRAFTVDAPPADVWPWLVQLGKDRAGWYLPRRVERFLLPPNRAIRRIEPRWQHLEVGDVIPDYGPDGSFEVAVIDAPDILIYTARRKTVTFTWAIALSSRDERATRVQLRLRIDPVRRRWLAHSAGDLFDAATIAGMAAGLRERLSG
ncbi:MAG: hypothetical protein ACR2LX_15320 [Jatrophihabitans sp.]